MNQKKEIKAIIGLGNPGKKFELNRHNIGFLIVDQLVDDLHGTWQSKDIMEVSQIFLQEKPIIVIKPQTFMNSSGKVIPFLLKKGIKAENILVVHDELELPFGKLKFRFGGSAKGHNGLRSIMDIIGKDFWRLSFGIARPEDRSQVGSYVLSDFSESGLEQQIRLAVTETINFIKKP